MKNTKPAAYRFGRNDDAFSESTIEGRNAIIEALRAGRQVDKLYIAKGETDKALSYIITAAKDQGAAVVEADRRKLDQMSRTGAHQGVIATVAAREYSEIEDILKIAEDRGEKPLVVICDELSDPHNLGAIIRSAECAGAHGVIIPKRRSAGLTPVVSKASAGAVEHMAICKVSNITAAINTLKEAGLWVFGAAAGGQTELYKADFKDAAAIVIGSEGEGMSRLVSENCDFLVSIPMKGNISSLNASAAAAILLYEAVRQRMNN